MDKQQIKFNLKKIIYKQIKLSDLINFIINYISKVIESPSNDGIAINFETFFIPNLKSTYYKENLYRIEIKIINIIDAKIKRSIRINATDNNIMLNDNI